MKDKVCYYCAKPGKVRIEAKDNDGKELRVCDVHWKLLSNPKTAIPLMQGTLASQLRGSVPESVLNRQMKQFLEIVKKIRPKTEIN